MWIFDDYLEGSRFVMLFPPTVVHLLWLLDPAPTHTHACCIRYLVLRQDIYDNITDNHVISMQH